MIERKIISGEEKSKYFIHNNGLAKKWEKLCSDLNGQIYGCVNGGILEFNMTFQTNEKNIHVYFLREKSNNQTGTLIDHGYLMTKNTKISISPINLSNNDWKIIKCKGLYKTWIGFFNSVQSLNFSDYYLITKNQRNRTSPISKDQLKNLTQIAELRRIITKDNVMTIEFFNALGTDSVMKVVKMYCAN